MRTTDCAPRSCSRHWRRPKPVAQAEDALGAKFDLKAFHDAVLAEGSVPLPVLEQRIDGFIADQRAKK
jgi:uncharacterized protein (DUF885 family)